MSSFVIVELRTQPPAITWGAATGTESGGVLSVGYSLDDAGAVTAASLRSGQSTLNLTITPTALMGQLPTDWPDGNALLTVDVVDDVGNEATYTDTIVIDGVAPPPSPTPSPTPTSSAWGVPRHQQRPTTRQRGRASYRTVKRSSRCTARSTTRVSQQANSRSRVTMLTDTSTSAAHQSASAATLRTVARREAQALSTSRVLEHGSAEVVRGDDPDVLAVLGLL